MGLDKKLIKQVGKEIWIHHCK